MKRWLLTTLAALTGTTLVLGVSLGSELEMLEFERTVSYVTFKVDTPTGWLAFNEYVNTGDEIYACQKAVGCKGNQDITQFAPSNRMRGFTKRNIVGEAAYDLFSINGAKIVEVKTVQEYRTATEPARKTYMRLALPKAEAADSTAYLGKGLYESGTTPVSSATVTYSVPSGADDDVLVLPILSYDSTNEACVPIEATYDGVALTQAVDIIHSSEEECSAIWYLVDPATGANSLFVDFAGLTWYTLAPFTLGGVDQSNPVDATAERQANGANATTSITTVADNAFIVDAVTFGNGDDITVGAGQTQRFAEIFGVDTTGGISTLTKTPAGAEIMDWTLGGSTSYALSVASFKPSSSYDCSTTETATSATGAGTGAEDAAFGTIVWSNTGNITANDAALASFTANGGIASRYIKGTNFGFALPAGAIVQGITMEVEALRNGGSTGAIEDEQVRIIQSDATISGTEDKFSLTDWSTSAGTFRSYGDGEDLWDLNNWLDTDIEDADFGIAVAATGTTATTNRVGNIDFIRATIDYLTFSCSPLAPPAEGGLIRSPIIWFD